MTLDRFLSLASLLALVYFAYGTWRIDRTLTKVEAHLDRIRYLISDIANK